MQSRDEMRKGVTSVERVDIASTVSAPADREEARDIGLPMSGLLASGLPMVLYAPDDTIAYMSPAYVECFEIPPTVTSFGDFIRHCHRSDRHLALSLPLDEWLVMAAAKRRVQPRRAFEIDMKDGRWFLITETMLDGGWLWNVLTDITVLKSNERILQQARDAARRAAATDPLTGLFNRRHAIEALQAAIQESIASGSILSVALIDLDRFKMVNDGHGHAVGDDVICHFAEAGRDVVRGDDFMARLGGDEFLWVMPGTDTREAEDKVARLAEHIRRAPPRRPGLTYTFSAGISSLDGHALEQMLERADQALYTAKNEGRDRISVA